MAQINLMFCKSHFVKRIKQQQKTFFFSYSINAWPESCPIGIYDF
jgi:hypothetical protein